MMFIELLAIVVYVVIVGLLACERKVSVNGRANYYYNVCEIKRKRR